MPHKINIFLSYSHKDEEFKEQLDTHFAPLKQDGTVETWNDRKLFGGAPVDEEINSKLREADVIIFLISADFLDSKYIRSQEFLAALDRHKKKEALAIGIVIRACAWERSEIKDYLLLPEDGYPIASSKDNHDEIYVKIIKDVLAAAENFFSRKEKTQTTNTTIPSNTPESTRKKEKNYKIPLPHEHNIGVKEEFFVKKMREFTDKLYVFTINSQEIISEQKDEYFKSGKSSKDACDNLLVFFQRICRNVNQAFFYWGGVRTHFRYLHISDEKYLKLAAAFGEKIDSEYALNPMPSVDEGMIYHAAQFEKPLIYSLNQKWHYPTGTTLESRDFKDYITFVLTNEAFKFHGEYLLSMGISFENPDRHRDFYYLMNLCRFDDVIVNIVKSYAAATNINIVNTIVENKDVIKRLFTNV